MFFFSKLSVENGSFLAPFFARSELWVMVMFKIKKQRVTGRLLGLFGAGWDSLGRDVTRKRVLEVVVHLVCLSGFLFKLSSDLVELVLILSL